MPEVTPAINDKAIHKWGRMIIAIGPETAPIPDTFFEADHMPIAVPTDYRDLGFVTTDGISHEDALTSEPTQMLQSIEPVRTDLTGREQTLTVAFGEDSAWVNAIWHGVPADKWGDKADAAWSYDDGELVDYPYYRILLIGQDGLGEDATYRVEFAYRAKVTGKEARVMNKTDPESFGFTFGLYRDPIVGKSFTRAKDAPRLSVETPPEA